MGASVLTRLHACVLSSQLIDYGKLGDTNERAMRMADFWLTVSAPCLLLGKESLENRYQADLSLKSIPSCTESP